MNELAGFAAYMLALAFGAGSVYFMVVQGRKDNNGLGRKVNKMIEQNNARYHRITLAIMLVCDEHQKERIAKMLTFPSDEDD
jgi:hypothetical protein